MGNTELLEAAFGVDLAPDLKLALIYLARNATEDGLILADPLLDPEYRVQMARFVGIAIHQASALVGHLQLTGFLQRHDGDLYLIAERMAR